MYKLMNISNHPSDLARFGETPKDLEQFLEKHQLHGVEVIMQGEWSQETLPRELTVGMHMCFWPIWLDFWRNNQEKLQAQFKNEEAYSHYYGGSTKETLVQWFRSELETAAKVGVKYVVFHVSHVTLEHCYNYQFDYSNHEVVSAFIELINEVFEGFKGDLLLLMENQWWPGLTLQDAQIMKHLMLAIKYPHKGFMLDIGHMMNTNTALNSESEAVNYILETLENLGEAAQWIKGIHLNSSLSGSYVEELIQTGGHFKPDDSFFDQYMSAFGHIGQIDQHQPFSSSEIQKVVKRINPLFLVHEFTVQEIEQLEHYLTVQNQAIGC